MENVLINTEKTKVDKKLLIEYLQEIITEESELYQIKKDTLTAREKLHYHNKVANARLFIEQLKPTFLDT